MKRMFRFVQQRPGAVLRLSMSWLHRGGFLAGRDSGSSSKDAPTPQAPKQETPSQNNLSSSLCDTPRRVRRPGTTNSGLVSWIIGQEARRADPLVRRNRHVSGSDDDAVCAGLAANIARGRLVDAYDPDHALLNKPST